MNRTLLGIIVGLAVGAGIFSLGAWGGGDVKLIGAIGAAVGPRMLLWILLWTAVAGGMLALVAMARGKRHFAYGPAIAIGFLVETAWPGGLAHVLLR